MQIIDPLSAGWGLDMLVSLQELALSFYINAPWFCLPGINAAPQPVTKSGSGVLPSSWLPSLTISRRISWGFPRQVFQIDSPWKFPRWQCSSRNGFYMISKIIYNYMSCFSKLKQNLPKKKKKRTPPIIGVSSWVHLLFPTNSTSNAILKQSGISRFGHVHKASGIFIQRPKRLHGEFCCPKRLGSVGSSMQPNHLEGFQDTGHP